MSSHICPICGEVLREPDELQALREAVRRAQGRMDALCEPDGCTNSDCHAHDAFVLHEETAPYMGMVTSEHP